MEKLISRLIKEIKEERGTAVVMLALSMTVLVGMTALVADVGLAYLERARLQNAVDAAVLAGIGDLPGDPVQAREGALSYAEKNGVDREELEVTISLDNSFLEVSTQRPVQHFFARVFNPGGGVIQARAKAQVGGISAIGGAAPLAIENHNFFFGEVYLLKQGANPGEDGEEVYEYEYENPYRQGFYGALALGGTGASRYENNLANGYAGVLYLGDIVPTESGNMSNPTKRAIDERIDRCEYNCTKDNFRRDCPRILTIPVYDNPLGEKKLKEIQIVGFAAFFAEEVLGQGNESKIFGYFVETIKTGDISQAAPDFGLRNGILVE